MNMDRRVFLASLSGLCGIAKVQGDSASDVEPHVPYRLRRKLDGAGSAFALSADGTRYANILGNAPMKTQPIAGAAALFGIWDVNTGKKVAEMRPRDARPSAFALSPNGRQLATVGLGRNVSIWDVATGKEIQAYHGSGGIVFAMAFSPDGKLLAETSHDSVNIWNVATGKKVQEFEEDGRLCGVAFSPNGQEVVAGAVGADEPIYAWNLATGKPLARYTGIVLSAPMAVPDSKVHQLAVGFTADGGSIFLAGKDATTCGLWDAETGRLLYRAAKSGDLRDAIFALNGRTMLVAAPSGVTLRDIATGKDWGKIASSAEIGRLAFSGNGKLLIGSNFKDGFVWDSSAAASRIGLELTGPEAEACWADLRTDDPHRASRIVARLIAAGDSSVSFLGKRAKPTPPLAPQRISQLIRDLDNDKFAVRQRAMDELEHLGAMAEEAFRQVLAAKPALEVRRRIEQIRKRHTSPYPTTDGDLLRTLRAIEVLEQVGTAEARKVLETLAKGAPKAPPTDEAKAALRRLARKAG